MYTILRNGTNELEIKKSRFISKIYKVKTLEEINEILKQLQTEYSDATHICYAYKIENTIKFSDDGEPGGTAGLPMMEVLNKNDLNFVLAVVIRYFGGIKLGSGGLVRAYSKGISELIQNIGKVELTKGYVIQITCSYENSKRLDYQLKGVKDIKKEFQGLVTYTCQVNQEMFHKLKEWNPIILEEIWIERP